MLVRLNKFLSDAGYSSRREADNLIIQKKVRVNNQVASLGTKVDAESDHIEVDGKVLKIDNIKLYYALYKPSGVVSTRIDPLSRQKVTDFVPQQPRVYPVGRLDYDSEGLIILTNDGELTQELTHPSFEHEKEYNAECQIVDPDLWKKYNGNLTDTFIKGLVIEDKLMKADAVREVRINDSFLTIRGIVLHTGYNRQIRKMCAKIGLLVKKLIRCRIGNLKLNMLGLKPGEYKLVHKNEIL